MRRRKLRKNNSKILAIILTIFSFLLNPISEHIQDSLDRKYKELGVYQTIDSFYRLDTHSEFTKVSIEKDNKIKIIILNNNENSIIKINSNNIKADNELTLETNMLSQEN